MNAIYDGKKVKITKLVLSKNDLITHPVVKQFRIEWKEKNKVMSDYVDANKVELSD